MAETEKPDLKEQVALLPLSPGVYQFVDRSGTIIYVGKAKSLRKRVSSYFVQSKEHSAKVRVLVKQIVEIRHIVVGSETDALLLENSLIKSLQPRYNILLKDDKTYPWIVVRREHFPRVQSTRILTRDGSQYFGPYGSVMMQRSVLDFIREVIPLRTCKLNLAPELIARDKYTVCLQYHLGNCKAPCVGRQSEEEYAQLVGMVVSVLKGDLRPVRQYLEGEMARAAGELKFELAQRYKQRLDALDNYAGRSVIVSAKIVDVDVFSLLPDDDVAWCNFVRIRHGSVVGVQTVKLSTGVGGDERDMLTLAIQHIVENIAGGELSREVIVPLLPSTTLLFEGVTFTVPKRGEKLELLEFSRKSARIYRAEQLKNLEIKNPERYTERLMNAVQKELRLDRQPRHIECFDNSNLQGAHPVASCVVFRDGKPSRKEYRHFNIKTVTGADDYASMREVVFRRYTRLMAEGAEMPDLIIAAGGKGQMGVIHGAGAARAGHPHCRTGQGRPAPHRRTALRLSARAGRHPSHFAPVPLFGAHSGGGAPFRRFLPPAETQQGVYPQRTGADRGGRGQDGPDPAAPFPHGGKGPCGQHRRTFGAGRGGKGEKNQGLFRKIAVFFEKLRKSPIFVHPIRRVTLAEMPGWRNR